MPAGLGDNVFCTREIVNIIIHSIGQKHSEDCSVEGNNSDCLITNPMKSVGVEESGSQNNGCAYLLFLLYCVGSTLESVVFCQKKHTLGPQSPEESKL